MSLIRILHPLLTASGLLLAVASAASAQPSNIFGSYVLFAQDNLRIRGTTTVTDGDIGVNEGILYLRGTIQAPKSDLAATVVHMDAATDCEDLFANAPVVGTASSCPEAPQNVPHPLLGDLAEVCGFPPPADMACASDASADRVVSHDQTESLAPGTYRNLTVEGGGQGPAVLKLNGTYHFCNIRVGRNGSILFDGPSTVTVSGSALVSNASDVGPNASLGAAAPAPGAIKWFIGGTLARFSRKGDIRLHVCAPNAKMTLGGGVSLTGRFAARSIRMKKSTITFAGPVPGVCGDTVVSPDEECESTSDCTGGEVCIGCSCGTPTTTTTGSSTTTTTVPGECDDDEDCNQGSPGGTFVCEDGHCVPGTSSTTTSTTTASSTTIQVTTTTTAGGTTSTTLHPCNTTDDCPTGVCVDGFCVPQCDSDDDCKTTSPFGSFICVDERCVPVAEACDDCRDNDNDGLVDFEDPDCCNTQTGQLFPMELRKGSLRSRSTSQTRLRMKANLASDDLGDDIDPPAQQVSIQIRSQTDGEVLCASIPAGKFVNKKRKGFRFSRKRTPVPVEIGRNIDRVQIKVRKNGKVAFRLKAKRAELSTPAQGQLQITVGFTRTGTPASENVCSQAVRLFRGGKKQGQLRFP